MSILNKFLNTLRLTDDDGYDDDDFLDEEIEEEEYEERQPKKRMFRKLEEEDDLEEEEDIPLRRTSRSRTNSYSNRQSAATPVPTSNKISPIRPRKAAAMEVRVIKPHSMEDAREITETLLSNRTVVLNMEGLDMEVAQRIIDFSSGSCYAIDGNLQKISSYIFIITPSTVDISGDFQGILGGAFDVPAIQV